MRKSKIFIITIIGILAILTLTGCNEKDNKHKRGEVQTYNQSTAFSIEYKGAQITPGTEFKEDAIDEEAVLSEIPSCAFEGTDKIYTYSGVEITVAKMDNKDKVYSVYFLDDSVETKEGVKITDSKDKMIEKYGENCTITMGTKYTYIKGNVELAFIVENDIITSIEYTLKTN